MSIVQDRDLENFPGPTGGDALHAIIKGSASVIPFVGGIVAELFGTYIQPSLAKREQDWLEGLLAELRVAQQRITDFNTENAFENPIFFTAFLHASQIAMRSHQKEKLEALRNAVLNAALPDAPDDDTQHMFLNFIDTLTPSHLKLLQFFAKPREYGENRGIS